MIKIKSIFCLTFSSLSCFAAAQISEPVYNGEIGRIINENCVVCHQEGGIGPINVSDGFVCDLGPCIGPRPIFGKLVVA